MSFKVIDFGTNRKPIYDFLLGLIINTNLPPILHRFHVGWCQIFASEKGSLQFNALAEGDSPRISP